MTVKEVHERMLNGISDTFDKSNGGFVYDVTNSIAIVVDEQSVKSDETLNKLNVDNLAGSELQRFVYQRAGVIWKSATFATTIVKLIGSPNQTVSVGSLVAAEDIFFEITESTSLDENGIRYVQVTCQQSGPIGNVPVGAINTLPVTLDGITSVINENAVTNGYAAESDESLRQRYYDKLQRPGKAGNANHYREWALSVVGVGKVKVYPLWNGPLTIKVLIVDANIELPSEELISAVFNYIESERPFGAIVTVDGASGLTINISVDITIAEGLTVEDVREPLTTKLTMYLKSLVFSVDYVSVAQIGKIILEVDGIIDYTNLTINGGTGNIVIPDGSIPILGTVTLL